MRFRQLLGGMTAVGAVVALSIPGVATAHDRTGGFVYTETNAAGGNAVLAYTRAWDGSLAPIGSFATGGLGSGGGIGSQGALTLAEDGRWLLAVNAGSDDVSVFRVREDGRLVLTDREDAAGLHPISVTANDGVAYVLDAGGAGNIAGFRLHDGRLRPIAGSQQPLSGAGTNPAEVAFSTNGRFLVVTERATSRIDTYRVDDAGRAGPPVTTTSAGPVPFGFAFDNRNHPIVSEAANSTLSSYRVGAAGATVVTASVPAGGLAACWVAVSPNGRWAFDTNAHSGTISSFAIDRDGSLSLAQAIAADAGATSTLLDLGASTDGRFLYVVEAGSHLLGGFALGPNGTLTAVPGAPVLPAGTSGIAVS